MKALLRKIRQILKDRRTRKIFTRFISTVAAIVVFVTTYALVLPAITMESQAMCGIEAHQHSDSCYEKRLTCGLEESETHTHTDSCYEKVLVCGKENHTHSTACYHLETATAGAPIEIAGVASTESAALAATETASFDPAAGAVAETTSFNPASNAETGSQDDSSLFGTDTSSHAGTTPANTTSADTIDSATNSALTDTTDTTFTENNADTESIADTEDTTNTEDKSSTGTPADPEDNTAADPADTAATEASADFENQKDTSETSNADPSSADPASEDFSDASHTTTSDQPTTDTNDTTSQTTADTPADTPDGTDNAATTAPADPANGATNAEPVSAGYVPALEELNFNTILNKNTTVYYHRQTSEDKPAEETTADDTEEKLEADSAADDTEEKPAADSATDENENTTAGDITDWKQTDKNTVLGENDLLRVYLAYTIPAGSLNETNPTARYRLPENIHLTDAQIDAINTNVNGIAAQYINYETLEITDLDAYNNALGIEAVDGDRTPADDLNEYLQNHNNEEFISATVRAENIYTNTDPADELAEETPSDNTLEDKTTADEENALLGTDLVFTFSPYAISKNQHEYDKDGKPTKAGEKIKGWLTLDFNMSQVDLIESAVDTVEQEADVKQTVENETEEAEVSETAAAVETVQRSERTADIVFVEEGRDKNGERIHEISTTLRVVEETEIDTHTSDQGEDHSDTSSEAKAREDNTAENQKSVEGNNESATGETSDAAEKQVAEDTAENADTEAEQVIMPAMSFSDSITVRTGKPSEVKNNTGGTVANAAETLPEKAEVSVRVEADEGTFPAGTTMKLAAVNNLDDVVKAVTETVENSTDSASSGDELEEDNPEQNGNSEDVNTERTGTTGNTAEQKPENANIKTYGFQAVDITFVDAEGNEVEPAKPVRVALASTTVEQVKKDAEGSSIADPVVVHVDDEGNAEQMELVDPKEIEPAAGRTEEELLKETENAVKADKASTADTADKAQAGGVTYSDDTVNNDEDVSSTVNFTADSFSVYAIVYTVDFHYDVDGQTYDYSIKGGDTVSLRELLPVLNVITDDTSTEIDEVQTFIYDIDSVRFSDESLVKVAHVDEDTTAGELKEKIKSETGEEPEYSSELTDEQIAEMNEKELQAPDWALVSLKAFDTEESLTVTMKSGEVFEICVTDARDPLGLNGRTFSIVSQRAENNNYYSVGTTTQNGANGQYVTARSTSAPTLNSDGYYYSQQQDVAWTFQYDSGSGGYYIYNNGKYLSMNPAATAKTDSSAVSLVTSKASANPVFISKNYTVNETFNSETQKYEYDYSWDGTYRFSNNEIVETFDEETNKRSTNENNVLFLWNYGGTFWADKTAAGNTSGNKNALMRLCLPENASGSHKASLISAKDLTDGQTVVVYQKVWNTNTDSFDYFAIDGNGNLQTVYESSDSIYWKEDISIQWKLTEGKNADGTPSGYLWLYNETTGKYMSPRSDGNGGYSVVHSISSDDQLNTVSVSLPGRDAEEYSSRIATWDYAENTTYGIDFQQSYNQQTGNMNYNLGVTELLKSRDFCFAVRDPLVQKQLTTVDTVDSVSKGIKISMFDFEGNRSWHSGRLNYMAYIMGTPGYAGGKYFPGIMSRTLGSDGYPTSVSGQWTGRDNKIHDVGGYSLKNVYEPPAGVRNDGTYKYYIARQVDNANHLFLQSVYDSTGYFYYSCFDNYATLPAGSSDFKVYEQVGTPSYDGTQFFYQRGNFMPFNDLDTSKSRPNLYRGDLESTELGNEYPRKAEDLYPISGTADYFFGMIMETKFQQGANGLTDRNDPMVFEFNGDDDLWIYIDGVLVFDLGGVHDAFHGKINFATGKITIDAQSTTVDINGNTLNKNSSGQVVTYIKEQYKQANRLPDGTAWDDARADEFFTNGGTDEFGQLIGTFKDYSTHDLKMFYMERGAGASNLEMQFNLPVITQDAFRVKKVMPRTATGEDIQNKYADATFYYKAYVRKNGQYTECTYNDYKDIAVYDDENKTPVVWKKDGSGNYTNIFEVKPGQTAIFPVASSGVEYYVEEVEPEPDAAIGMLDKFKVSNSDQDPNDSKKTKKSTVKKRGMVIFENKPIDDLVNELHITKKLHGNMYKVNPNGPDDESNYIKAAETNSPFFEYKVYFEATSGKMVPYALGEYYQIDAEGNYVYYDNSDGGKRKTATVTEEGGIKTYHYTYKNSSKNEDLTAPKITEHTSQNGSIGDIRDGDTIIIKGLLEGTDFVVDERTDRSHMTATAEGNWNRKYYFSDTDVEDAYVRSTGANAPANLLYAGTLYAEPDYSGISVNGQSAKGTILAEKNAEVTVHNEVYNTFELPLEKKWPTEEFSMSDLDANAEVSLTLKRYRLVDKTGGFTFKADVSGQPSGYDPVYTFIDSQTNEAVISIRYSELEAVEGTIRQKTFSLPVGTYNIVRGDDPQGYNATHTQTSDTVTITSNEDAATGAVASPEVVTFTSRYTQQTGSITVIKNLGGYSGGFSKFRAVYSVTDAAGNPVRDADGQTVQPVTLTNVDFASNGSARTKTISFNNLLSGKYYISESIDAGSYDNSRYTVVNTVNPENAEAIVSSAVTPEVVFTSTYTEVKQHTVPIIVKDVSYGKNDILYSNNTFRPGDQVIISWTRNAGNPTMTYRVNGGSWNLLLFMAHIYGYVDIREEVRMTVPEGGITVEIDDLWNQISGAKDNISVVADTGSGSGYSAKASTEETLAINAPNNDTEDFSASEMYVDEAVMGIVENVNRRPVVSAGPSAMIALKDAGTRKLVVQDLGKAATEENVGPVTNSADLPAPSETEKRYDPDSWMMQVVMKNDGKLYDSAGHQIGTVTVDGTTWNVRLKGADIDGLKGTDDDGNYYYYYIDSVSEKKVPEGMTPSVDTDVISSKEYKRLYGEPDMDSDKKLSVTNVLVTDTEIVVYKTDSVSNATLGGAVFKLVDSNNHNVTGYTVKNASTQAEITPDAEQKFEIPDDGVIISGLKKGTYKLVECSAPGGYVILNNETTFTVEKGNVTSWSLSGTPGSTLRIPNEMGVELPSTGGPGTTHLYLLGLILTALAGAGLAMKHRNKVVPVTGKKM